MCLKPKEAASMPSPTLTKQAIYLYMKVHPKENRNIMSNDLEHIQENFKENQANIL